MDRKTVRNVLDWYKHTHTKEVPADVVKVVRCKECKHADLFYPYCTIWEAAIDGDGYCYGIPLVFRKIGRVNYIVETDEF